MYIRLLHIIYLVFYTYSFYVMICSFVLVSEHFLYNFIKVLQSLFIMLLVSLYLFFFILCLFSAHFFIRLYDTFELNWSVHFKFVFELPFTAYVELFRECFFPVREELLSFRITLARVHNFVPFSISSANWRFYNYIR